jgi:pyruvate-ferredoxin/flavodoxin oxidoreductase
MNRAMEEMREAVRCGYWNLMRFDPSKAAAGKNPLSIDSHKPTESYRDFIMGEVRYNSLKLNFPERAEELFAKAEEMANERYETLINRKKSFDN